MDYLSGCLRFNEWGLATTGKFSGTESLRRRVVLLLFWSTHYGTRHRNDGRFSYSRGNCQETARWPAFYRGLYASGHIHSVLACNILDLFVVCLPARGERDLEEMVPLDKEELNIGRPKLTTCTQEP